MALANTSPVNGQPLDATPLRANLVGLDTRLTAVEGAAGGGAAVAQFGTFVTGTPAPGLPDGTLGINTNTTQLFFVITGQWNSVA
ncbi:MAG: hypothetical protein C5B60_02615 [Chloroflexi bacterium]|nr:MAG: hypothetical protein C5B60_02615 [Chloroflexota bacterium]